MQAEHIDNFLHLFPGPKVKVSGGYNVQCPAHDDKNPSLSVSYKDDRVLLHCHAGCKTSDILKELGLTTADLFHDSKDIQQIETGRYFYHDVEGRQLYFKVRLEPGRKGRDKEFIFKHGDSLGRGCDPVLYNLHNVINSDTVCFVEGEKKADILNSWGLCGTCLDSGADSKLKPYMIQQLTGKDIVILPDNDEPGKKYKDMLISFLQGKAVSIRVVELPGLPDKGDIVDWTKAGHSKDELLDLVVSVPEHNSSCCTLQTYTDATSNLVCVSLEDFLSLDIPPRTYIVEPIISEQGLIMIYAWRGTGKTYLVLYLLAVIASGSPFLKWTVNKPVGCLYIDGELPASDLQLRYQQIIAGLDNEICKPVKIIPLGLQDNGMPDISTPEGQAAYEQYITDDIQVIVIDNLTTLARTGRENEGESWLSIQSWALKLRAKGKTVIFIHHSGKNREQRGTSRREDTLDTVICLKQPSDATYQDGRFEIHFEKNRNFTGADAVPIEVQMTKQQSGAMTFTWKASETSVFDKVVSLYKDGLTSPTDIAEELKINKSTASRHISKARIEGLIS